MKLKIVHITLIFYLLQSCVEEVPIATEVESAIAIEEVLVVEATLTDERKRQGVILSRGSSFANDSITTFVQNATVSVIDDQGNVFDFIEGAPGHYESAQIFGGQEDTSYRLEIRTDQGVGYRSEWVEMQGRSVIEDVYAQRIVSSSGSEGMGIFVDSANPNGELNDYRYTYEETYKIIAPNWTPFEFEIIREATEVIRDTATDSIIEILYPDVRLIPRAQEEQVCYNSSISTDIILSDGLALTENRIRGNLVRFINRSNPIISHRYSILVKQYLQSPDARAFYRKLLQFSQNASLFSEVQPGFLEGNMFSEGDEAPLVIGFFNVASVAERRLFFNYEDFFSGEALPPYFGTVNCDRLIAPILGNPLRDGPPPPGPFECADGLIPQIFSKNIEFFDFNDVPDVCEGPYLVTQRECGDCTALGSNVEPDFWED